MACSKTVLIVDDDEDIRDALAETLRDEGHDALAVADGPSALGFLRTRAVPPCLVLLDWNMVPMNGGEVIAAIRQDPALSTLPVVLVSADVAAQERAQQPGFVAYLKKPMDLNALFAVVRQHCA